MNRSLVSRRLATLFVCSSSFARRDRSLFANLHGIIIRISKYSVVLDHEVEIPGLHIIQSFSSRVSLTTYVSQIIITQYPL